jgi:hypothetical protein
MRIKFTYGPKTYYLEPYTTAQEKELILIQAYTDAVDVENLDDALRICKFEGDIRSLTLQEKILLLWKYREISISDKIEVKFHCPHCGSLCENSINISNLYTPALEPSETVYDNMDETGEVNISDDADLDDYINASKDIVKHIGHYNFVKSCKCLKCKKDININLSDPKFVLDNMSDKSLQGMYSQYNTLVYFGHYTKLDIDSMYPFERDVLSGILEKTLKDLNKAKGSKGMPPLK